jgi:hypothetical protein
MRVLPRPAWKFAHESSSKAASSSQASKRPTRRTLHWHATISEEDIAPPADPHAVAEAGRTWSELERQALRPVGHRARSARKALRRRPVVDRASGARRGHRWASVAALRPSCGGWRRSLRRSQSDRFMYGVALYPLSGFARDVGQRACHPEKTLTPCAISRRTGVLSARSSQGFESGGFPGAGVGWPEMGRPPGFSRL